jgi:hypothetical protein
MQRDWIVQLLNITPQMNNVLAPNSRFRRNAANKTVARWFVYNANRIARLGYLV